MLHLISGFCLESMDIALIDHHPSGLLKDKTLLPISLVTLRVEGLRG